MNKKAPIFLSCLLILGLSKLCIAQQPTSATKPRLVQDYKLVWSDEFNDNGMPDTSNWSFESGFKRNHEDQWYQDENARCKDGFLTIEAKRVEKRNPEYVSGSEDWRKRRALINYTSSSINTSGKKSWQYGRFIVRAKIDTSAGIWPAFWTLGTQGKWPANGEIDIMEFYKGKILANVACADVNSVKAKWFSTTKDVTTFKEKNWSQQFHIWRMDWDKDAISLYVDDLLLNKVPLDSLVNRDGSNINPFKQTHYILLNLAIGGDNGGDPSMTTFPSKFVVDYVRVYQIK
jgi:beta-glucanase (GH16 family)